VLRFVCAEQTLARAELQVDALHLREDCFQHYEVLLEGHREEEGVVQVLRDCGCCSSQLLLEQVVHDHLVRGGRCRETERHAEKLKQPSVREESCFMHVVGVHWNLPVSRLCVQRREEPRWSELVQDAVNARERERERVAAWHRQLVQRSIVHAETPFSSLPPRKDHWRRKRAGRRAYDVPHFHWRHLAIYLLALEGAQWAAPSFDRRPVSRVQPVVDSLHQTQIPRVLRERVGVAGEYFEQLRLLCLGEVRAHLELGLHGLPLFLIRQTRERDGVHLAYVGRVVNLALRGGGLVFQRV
jgi:hypothetical protein